MNTRAWYSAFLRSISSWALINGAHFMSLLIRKSLVLFCYLFVITALAQPAKAAPPGLQSYVPTRIEWLSLVLNSQLRQDATVDNPFSVNIVNTDHETILIFVRYHPNVNREIMNMAIDTAREVINITAKSYGWDKWVKIKERIELARSQDKNSGR